MKHLAILLLLITLCGCGEIRGQYHKVVSPDEVVTGTFYCTTFLKIPVLCGVYAQTEKTIRIVDIVYEVVERIVEIEVEIEVEKIVTEVYTVYRDKDVDLEVIIAEVIRRVKRALPPAQIRQDVDVPSVVSEVSHAVIENTPYVESGEVLTPPAVISEPATPEIDDSEYVVFSHLVDGKLQSGLIHSDYVEVGNGTLTFTDGSVYEYVEVETELTYEEGKDAVKEILSE